MQYVKTSIFIALAAGAGLVVAGCSSSSGEQKAAAITVQVEYVKPADASQVLAYSGTIEESAKIPLSFSSIGTVSQVLVAEGSVVRKGQLLATLDNASYRNAYAMAQATEKQAQDAYRRLTPMHENGTLPEIKYVEVETSLQQATAAAAIAEKNLHDCNLYATTDGFVGKRSIDPGMAAVPNLVSITLVKIAYVYARVSVPENEISLVKTDDHALINIGALGNREYSGTVREIGVVADPLVHTYRIKIGINNENYEIKPGMICKVVLENRRAQPGLVVSGRAVLVDENGNNYVYMVSSQNKAVKRYVTTGDFLNDGIEIVAGLQANEAVIVAGQHKLTDNALVQIAHN